MFFKQVADNKQTKVSDFNEAFLSSAADDQKSGEASGNGVEKWFELYDYSQNVICKVLVSASYSGKPVNFLKKSADDQAKKE